MEKITLKELFDTTKEETTTITLDGCYQTCSTSNNKGWGEYPRTFKKSDVVELILDGDSIYDTRLFIAKEGSETATLWRKKK